ncbi:MAG: NADH-quinone oxidoreductase subunit H [Alicyclobacillus sp.]|nr:NADH-quinone oxidoreductase subunit H [Alicyclobacillus sp.]
MSAAMLHTSPELPAPSRHRQPFWRFAWRTITKKPGRLVGFLIMVLFALMAIVGPYLYPKDLPIDPDAIYAPVSWKYPLGTDFEGTSNLALVVTGTRYLLFAAAMGAVFTVLFGTVFGLVAGYYRGWTDSVIMRITDFILTIPSFPLLVVLSTVWNFGEPVSMGFVLGITGWGGLARAIRSQTLSLRERGFVEAARGLGLSPLYILFREVLPNVGSYVAMNLLLAVTGSIYSEVGLFFLGEYTHMITTSFLFAVVFCGGWHLPFGLTDGQEWYHMVLKLVSILGKAAFFLFFYVWVRWTLPRFRFDQLMDVAWKVLIPLSLSYLVVVMVVREFDLPLFWLPAASIGLFLGAAGFAANLRSSPTIRKTGQIHGLPTAS